MCIYGMDSPGGYQLMGRTIPIWDSYGAVPESHRGAPTEKPWLLRFFDRVRYYLVSDDELEDLRAKYKRGELVLDIQEGEFSYANHKEFLKENESSISEFQQLQSKAFAEERKRWEEAGETAEDASAKHAAAQVVSSDVKEDKPLQLYAVRVRAGVAATVFGVLAEDGEEVEAGQPLVSMESMKVEIMVEAPVSGTVKAVSVSKGDSANADTTLCEVHSTKELAFGDMTLMHLRTMYKIGVLELESAALAMQQSAKDAKAVVETADMAEDLKNLRKLVGRKYLPLFGASFVYAAVDGESPKKVVEALKSAGAVLVGRAESFLSASQLVAGKHVCFNVGGGMIDARGGEMAASAPLSSKYCVYAQTKEDAKIVSDAVSESVSKQESSGSCGVGWQCALS